MPDNSQTNIHERDKIELGFVLDFNSDPILFVDNAFIMKYVNYKALSLFQLHQNKFKKHWGDFNPNALIGSFAPFLYDMTKESLGSILNLHFGQSLQVATKLEDLHFQFRVSPIFNLQGERLGLSFHIVDITHLIEAKELLNNAIDKAKNGDFSNHTSIQYPNHSTIFGDTFYKVNQLIFVMDNFMNELQMVLDGLSQGDLTSSFDLSNQLHENHQLTLFDLFKQDTNSTVQKLNQSMSKLSHQVATITETIHRVWQNNFELVMHLQLENAEGNEIQAQIDSFLDNLRRNNAEIQQAVEFLDSYSVEDSKAQMKSFSNQLTNSIHEVGHSTERIVQITQNVQFILNTHLQGLRQGLDLINNGSIGKGIKLITHESQEIVSKSNHSIFQVKEMLTKINLEFSKTKESIHDFNQGLDSNLDQMTSFVTVLRSVLTEINNNISGQNTIFDDLAQYIHKMKQSKVKTIDTVENTIINTVSMQEIINLIHLIMNEFRFNDKPSIEEFDDESYISTIMSCINSLRQDLPVCEEQYTPFSNQT